MARWLVGLGALLLGASCGSPTHDARVVIVIIDDIGIDKLSTYTPDAERLPPTPHIDALAERGVRFQNAYAAPTCSPSRAALLTGRYGRRYGIGVRIEARSDITLPLHEVALPRMLQQAAQPWQTALVGKWHLVGMDADDPYHHPNHHGFDTFSGSMWNLNRGRQGEPTGYHHWEKVTNGNRQLTDTYATTDTVNEAVRLLQDRHPPHLLVVSFNAAHTPLEEPPEHLVSEVRGDRDVDVFDRMVEAMDTELGRLLDEIWAHHPQTTVFLVGDNGTSPSGIRGDPDTPHKGSVYEGGVRVPFVVAGPDVADPGATSEALVHLVDVFPTVAELAGLEPAALHDREGAPLQLDGQSLLPWLVEPAAPSPRDVLFSEAFTPNGPPPYEVTRQTVRTLTHKLVRSPEGEELFVLGPGLDEGDDRLTAGDVTPAEQALAADLGAALDALVDELPYEDPLLRE